VQNEGLNHPLHPLLQTRLDDPLQPKTKGRAKYRKNIRARENIYYKKKTHSHRVAPKGIPLVA